MKKSALITVEKVLRLKDSDSAVVFSICRFANCRIDSKRKNVETKFFRREAVTLKNNKAKIIRFAVGAKDYPIKKNEVGLDYDAIDALGVRYGEQEDLLTVRRAYRWEIWWWFINHPEISIRFATRVGVIGILLGVAGVVLGTISLL